MVVMADVVYAGDAEAGERAMAPFRALATPLADLVRPMPYPEIYPPEDPADADYHPLAVSRTLFMDRVDTETAGLIVDRLAASDATVRVQLHVLGGRWPRFRRCHRVRASSESDPGHRCRLL
jgi:hypothetical protein